MGEPGKETKSVCYDCGRTIASRVRTIAVWATGGYKRVCPSCASVDKSTRPYPVICPYCDSETKLEEHTDTRYSVDPMKRWVCQPCQAWVGTHKYGSWPTPLGRVANRQLRQLKITAHEVFDPLWECLVGKNSRRVARAKGYKWLADRLSISVLKCHIGWFDEARCKRVINICKKQGKKPIA